LVAVGYGVAVWLLCILFGAILTDLGVPIAATIGRFLERFAVVLGFLAFIFAFAGGPSRLPGFGAGA
jgi:hypothetical protein